MLGSLRESAQALEPFRKQLADQITFLGSDLTPSAMTALKPNADKLNASGSDAVWQDRQGHRGRERVLPGVEVRRILSRARV